MKGKALAALFVVSYLLVLVCTAPASLLREFLPEQPGLSMGKLQGSIWSGSIEWIEADGLHLGPLHWFLNPLALAGATPLSMRFEHPVSGAARLGFGPDEQLLLSDGQLSATAVELLQQLDYPNLGVDARVTLVVDSAELAPPACRALNGVVQVDDWQGELDGLADIGLLEGRLSCDQGRVEVTVNPENAINLSGTLVIHSSGGYQLNMRAAPPPGPLYDNFVQLFGQPRDGRHFILQARS